MTNIELVLQKINGLAWVRRLTGALPWRWWKRILITGAVLLVIGLLYLWMMVRGTVEVRIVEAKQGDMTITVSATATGTIESEAVAKISAQTIGKVEKLLVEEGDRVQAGQPLALLDPKEALANLNLARANLAAAQANLAQVEAGVDLVDTQTRAQLEQTKVNFENAQKNLKRYQDLFAQGAIAHSQLDQALSEYSVAKANYDTALANLAQNKMKVQDVAGAKARVKQMAAQLEMAQVQYDRTIIRAPFAGLVSVKHIEAGELVVVGTPIFSMVSPEQIYVKATIDEFDAARIKIGQLVHVTVDAFPGKVFAGHIYKISPVVSGERQETRTFIVKVALDADKSRFKTGMSADIEVVADHLPKVIYIPTQAVVEREAKKYVFLVKGRRVYLKPVEIGASNWNLTEIKSGLEERQRVVITPDTSKLKDGTRIKEKAGNAK